MKRFQPLYRSTIKQNTTFAKDPTGNVNQFLTVLKYKEVFLFGITTYLQRTPVKDLWEHYGHEPKPTNTEYIIFISVITTILISTETEAQRM